MQTIHKFPLASSGDTAVELPANARPLSVGFQPPWGTTPAQLVLWALVPTDQRFQAPRTFRVILTGGDASAIRTQDNFIGTASNPNGLGPGQPFVVHVFEVF